MTEFQSDGEGPVVTRVSRMRPEDVRIDRATVWGNPFVIGRDGSRSDVIRLYADWIVKQPHLIARLHELRGRNLACWCAPLPCHGDVLLRLANK